jgi:glycosyltransferase involved in cell wall biosynthesis
MTTRVLFFGTHPKQFNGYSKVVYEIIKCMSNKTDRYEFFVYGFQNSYINNRHRMDIPDNVNIYDAQANENPKKMGFGITEIKEYVALNKPDVCIVYNDMLILHQVITQLKEVQKEQSMNFKIIAYIDQIYLNQKKQFINFINENADMSMMFTSKWEECIKKQGLTTKTCFLPHGFNSKTYFPIRKDIARQYFNMNKDDFLILNLNRNQPRKRWDTCIKAFAEVVSRCRGKPIKMIIATAIQGGWNLLELYERELQKRNITLEEGMKHIVLVDRPQQMTDEETNILYNVADIGINTCDGEGFGLCNFEQAAIGIPQIVPRLGGFEDFLDDTNASLIEPQMAYYVDNTRDMVCGEALLCDYSDFADAIQAYFDSPALREEHGSLCRKQILEKYKWTDIVEKMCSIIDQVCPRQSDLVEKLDPEIINSLVNEIEEIEDKTKSDKMKEILDLQEKLNNLIKSMA